MTKQGIEFDMKEEENKKVNIQKQLYVYFGIFFDDFRIYEILV